MALLLIDNRTLDIPFLLRCLESNVTPIIFDFERETFESLTEKIPQQRYSHLGILQDNRNSKTYCMILSFGQCIIEKVSLIDPRLETWTSFHLFIELCMSGLGVSCLDLIECNLTKDWDYLSQEWNIPIRYSSKPIGGTHWSLDQGSLIGLYFTRGIESYPHMLGEAAISQVSLLDYRGQCYLFGLETEMVTVPTFISTEIPTTYASEVSTGTQNTIITLNDKTVYGYGKDNGEMGLTLNTNYTTPTLVPISNVLMSSQGLNYGLYLKENGDVFGTGKNTYGNLGINSTVDQYGVFVRSNVSNIMYISCGPNYACFLDKNRNLYGSGKDDGQFGTGDIMNPILLATLINRVSAGDKHMVLLYPNGTVYCKGDNTYGQLGNGTTTLSSTPVQVYTEYGSPLTNITYVDANMDMCLAIDTTLRLWVWGNVFNTIKTTAIIADTNVEWAKIFKMGILNVKDNLYYILYGSLSLFPQSSGLLLYPNGTAISYDTTVGANICFPMGTPIVTDQGTIPIDRIVARQHTIHGREIDAITHTYSLDKELVCFEKDSLRKNYPSQQTIMSRLHKLYFKGEMKSAYHFVGKHKGVYTIPYEKQILYNVLMKEPETMNVNGFICETLNPQNPICKIFK